MTLKDVEFEPAERRSRGAAMVDEGVDGGGLNSMERSSRGAALLDEEPDGDGALLPVERSRVIAALSGGELDEEPKFMERDSKGIAQPNEGFNDWALEPTEFDCGLAALFDE